MIGYGSVNLSVLDPNPVNTDPQPCGTMSANMGKYQICSKKTGGGGFLFFKVCANFSLQGTVRQRRLEYLDIDFLDMM